MPSYRWRPSQPACLHRDAKDLDIPTWIIENLEAHLPTAADNAQRRWKISFDILVFGDTAKEVDTTKAVAILLGPDGASRAENDAPQGASADRFLHFRFDKECDASASYRLSPVDYVATTLTVPEHSGFIGES